VTQSGARLDRLWRWVVRGAGLFVFLRSGIAGSPDFGAMAVGAAIALLPNSDKAVEMVWRLVDRSPRPPSPPE
jgi:hypothetical protein